VFAQISIPVRQKGALASVFNESFKDRKTFGYRFSGFNREAQSHRPSKESLSLAPSSPGFSLIAFRSSDGEVLEHMRNRQPTTSTLCGFHLYDRLGFEEEKKDLEDPSLAANDEEDQSMRRLPRKMRQAYVNKGP